MSESTFEAFKDLYIDVVLRGHKIIVVNSDQFRALQTTAPFVASLPWPVVAHRLPARNHQRILIDVLETISTSDPDDLAIVCTFPLKPKGEPPDVELDQA